jgi:hypothetical protein
VLEFARGDPLGVLVADLLELERPLKRDGMAETASDEEERLAVGVRLGDDDSSMKSSSRLLSTISRSLQKYYHPAPVPHFQ